MHFFYCILVTVLLLDDTNQPWHNSPPWPLGLFFPIWNLGDCSWFSVGWSIAPGILSVAPEGQQGNNRFALSRIDCATQPISTSSLTGTMQNILCLALLLFCTSSGFRTCWGESYMAEAGSAEGAGEKSYGPFYDISGCSMFPDDITGLFYNLTFTSPIVCEEDKVSDIDPGAVALSLG